LQVHEDITEPPQARPLATKLRIQEAIDNFWSPNNQLRLVCSCCDEPFAKKNMTDHIVDEETMSHLEQRLPWLDHVPQQVRNEYILHRASTSPFYTRLLQVVLSPRGVKVSFPISPVTSSVRQEEPLELEWGPSDDGEDVQDVIRILPQQAPFPQPVAAPLTSPIAEITLQLCTTCVHVIRHNSADRKFPPKLSLANNWVQGSLPQQFKDLLVAEIKMCTMAPTTAFIKIIGRNRHALMTHSMALLLPEGPASTQVCINQNSLFHSTISNTSIVQTIFNHFYSHIIQVPHNLSMWEYMVIFSGLSTAEKKRSLEKFARVRGVNVGAFTDWLFDNSVSYDRKDKDQTVIDSITADGSLEHLVDDEGDEGTLITAVTAESDRPSSTSLGIDQCQNTTSAVFTLRDTGVNHTPSLSTAEGVTQAPGVSEPLSFSSTAGVPYVRVTRGTAKFLKSTDPIYYGAAFPKLFPFGIGTPNCARPNHVSIASGAAHLLRVSDRRFGQDKDFVFSLFDRISIQSGFRALNVQLHCKPGTMSSATTITVQQMTALMQHNHDSDKSRRCGRGVPELPESLQSADKVLRSVHAAARNTYATKEEREAMSKQVTSYCQVNQNSVVTYTIYLYFLTFLP
jgi:hypothetical protein